MSLSRGRLVPLLNRHMSCNDLYLAAGLLLINALQMPRLRHSVFALTDLSAFLVQDLTSPPAKKQIKIYFINFFIIRFKIDLPVIILILQQCPEHDSVHPKSCCIIVSCNQIFVSVNLIGK